MPLATRFFLTLLIVLVLIGAIGWAVRRFGPVPLPSWMMRRRHRNTASGVFKVLFWIHQFVFGLPAMMIILYILAPQSDPGLAVGTLSITGLLAWIGGTLVWGLAAIMHQRPPYELLAEVNENIARLGKMQVHEMAVGAVAEELTRQGKPNEAELSG